MKKRLLVILFAAVYASSFSQSRLSEQIGSVRRQSPIPGGIQLELSNAFVQITAYNPTTLRFRITRQRPAADFSFAVDSLRPKGALRQATGSNNQLLTLQTDSITLHINRQPFSCNILNAQGKLLVADDTALRVSWFGNQVSAYKHLRSDEKFVGLGEKTGGLNRRGNFFYHWNSDVPGYGVNQDPLYASIPFFIGIRDSAVYGIFFDNPHKTYFNFGGGADEDIYHFGADDGELNYYVFTGSSVARIIEDYTALTGRTPMPPLWSLGFQQSRWGYDSQKELLDIARQFREKKLPADVIVSDIPYMDAYKVFTWHPVKFADPAGMMQQMRGMGFDVVTIIDPGIKIEPGYPAYESGLRGNHFVRYPNGRPYVGHVWPGRCHFPDFTRPATRAWWGESFRQPLVNIGVKGFWNDMNEPAAWGREFPNLIEFGEGSERKTLFTVKNAYGSLMSKATYEGTRSLMKGERPFVLTRAAYAGIQKYSAVWTGDNVSSDEHMLLGFRLLNSMGVSGVPYVGMDIGGFMGNPSPELFMRWLDLAVYSPLFRNHTHIGYNYREPWQFGEFNTEKIRRILEKRYQLLPHLYSSFYQAHVSGLPVNRMLPVYYPFDSRVFEQRFENQFFFGDNMLVCPVASNQQMAEVYLPGEVGTTWFRWSDGTRYAGGQSYKVSAPIDDAPVFVRAGAIVPMQSVVQHTKEPGDGILILHVWPGGNKTEYLFYEDDGSSYQYEQGHFTLRAITHDHSSGKLRIAPATGTFSSRYRQVRLVYHDVAGKKEAVLPYTPQEIEFNLQALKTK